MYCTRTLTIERMLPTIQLYKGLSHNPLLWLTLGALKGIHGGKNQHGIRHSAFWINWPLDSYDADLRKNFSDPRFLHLPIHRRSLKSSTWDSCSLRWAVIFYQDLCLTSQKHYISPGSSPTSSKQSSQSYWEAVSQAIVLSLAWLKLSSILT